jgi:hypothetical protein
MDVYFAHHLVAILASTNFEKSEALVMNVELLAISGKAEVLTHLLVGSDFVLDIEKDTILFDLFYLLEKLWIECSFLDIEADSINFLRNIKF